MAVIAKDIDFSVPLSDEQVRMLDEAAKRPISPDADAPELNDAQVEEIKALIDERKAARRKQNVTLRLSPRTIQKAKALGKGYSGILSKIIETTLDNPELLKQCL